MIFDVLSDGYHPVAQFRAQVLPPAPISWKGRKNWKNRWSQNRSRISLGITRDHQRSLGMIPDVPGCTWVISGNFQNFMIFMNISNVPPEKSASHPSSLCNRECPKSRIHHINHNHFWCSLNWSKSHFRGITGPIVCATHFKIMKKHEKSMFMK